MVLAGEMCNQQLSPDQNSNFECHIISYQNRTSFLVLAGEILLDSNVIIRKQKAKSKKVNDYNNTVKTLNQYALTKDISMLFVYHDG